MTTSINKKIFLVFILFFTINKFYGQCIDVSLLNVSPTNAFVGPAASCNNNTGEIQQRTPLHL